MPSPNKLTGKKFKVTIKLPDHVSEYIKREKINRLYDILKPKNSNDEDDKNSAKTA